MKVYLWYLIRAHQQPKFHLIVTHIKGIFKVKSNQNLDLGHIFNRARYMYMYCKCMFTFREVSSSMIPYRRPLSTSWRRSSHCTILTTDSPWWKLIMRRCGKPFLSLFWLYQCIQCMYKFIKLFLRYLSGIVFIVSGQKSQYRVLVSHLICLIKFS